jgi:two-component system catabolic regulation response regulator CreB
MMAGTNVVIVEDEPSIADTIIYALETEGIANRWTTTGGEAVDLVRAGGVDLVLLDIGLPDQSGFDVCRAIRAFSDVPIIFLTSRNSEIDQVVGLELGADDYVTKPFSPRVLTARIRSRLRPGRQAAEPSEPAAPLDGLWVDEGGQRVLLGQADLTLSRYEFRIMRALIASPGRVYSRAQLMDIGWEEPDASFDRTVDTHIKTIRQKVKQLDPAYEPIKTHRGLGYSYRRPSYRTHSS